MVLTLHIYLSTYLFAYFIHSGSLEDENSPSEIQGQSPGNRCGETLSLRRSWWDAISTDEVRWSKISDMNALTWWSIIECCVSERVLWNAWTETLFDVVQSRGTKLGVHILTVFTNLTWHTVRCRDVMWTSRSNVYTQLNPTCHKWYVVN